jgi:phage baseplate assembly protein W
MNNRIVGYSSGENGKQQVLSDLDLAKQDLKNHFGIRKGEKWTNPEFGSNLPYYVFQPLDDATISLIDEDVLSVVNYDPRFRLDDNALDVDKDGHEVVVSIRLVYLPTTTPTDLILKFNREEF